MTPEFEKWLGEISPKLYTTVKPNRFNQVESLVEQYTDPTMKHVFAMIEWNTNEEGHTGFQLIKYTKIPLDFLDESTILKE